MSRLSHCVQDPPAALHRVGRNQREGDHAGNGAAVNPIMYRATLNEDVAPPKLDNSPIQFHVDFAIFYLTTICSGSIFPPSITWRDRKDKYFVEALEASRTSNQGEEGVTTADAITEVDDN